MNVHITVPLEDLRQLPDLEQFLDNMRNNSRRGITSLQSNDRTMDRWTLG